MREVGGSSPSSPINDGRTERRKDGKCDYPPSFRLSWALQELNLRPTDYQSPALTRLSEGPALLPTTTYRRCSLPAIPPPRTRNLLQDRRVRTIARTQPSHRRNASCADSCCPCSA